MFSVATQYTLCIHSQFGYIIHFFSLLQAYLELAMEEFEKAESGHLVRKCYRFSYVYKEIHHILICRDKTLLCITVRF